MIGSIGGYIMSVLFLTIRKGRTDDVDSVAIPSTKVEIRILQCGHIVAMAIYLCRYQNGLRFRIDE